MTYNIIISNARIVTPLGVLEKNIVINDGKIVQISSDTPQCNKKIDGTGKVVIPGMIDTHVHYGVYSPIDVAATSESHAAAIGGVTTMMRMLRLEGSFKELLQAHLDTSAKSHYVDYAIHASIFNETQIEEMNYCVKQGITSFKLYMNLGGEVGHVYMDLQPNESTLHETNVEVGEEIIRGTIKMAASLNCPVLIHAEDYESCACGIKTSREKNLDGLRAWSDSRAPKYEVKAIEMVSRIAREFGCVLYFVHIGSSAALKQIKIERQSGTIIHVETCPHYLTLVHEEQAGYLPKVMPPIRSSEDRDQVWRSLSTGIIDTIGTDHVANQLKLKLDGKDIWSALAGFPGIGTALPILLGRGVNQNRITIEQLVNITSTNAAKIFGMYPNKGIIQEGSDADLVLVDMKMTKKIHKDMFGAYSDYSVYEGMEIVGWPVMTILRGGIVAENFEVVGEKGAGQFVPRKHIDL